MSDDGMSDEGGGGDFMDKFMLELQPETPRDSSGWQARTPITRSGGPERIASLVSPASARANEEVEALKASTLSLEATMGSPLKELRALLEMPFMAGAGEEDIDDEERSLRSGIADWFGGGTPLSALPTLPPLADREEDVPNYPEIREFLEEIGLQGSYREFVVDLGAMSVQDLYVVEEQDLENIGLKKLEIRRFMSVTAAEDDDAIFEEIEREMIEAGYEDRPMSPSQASLGGSLTSADEALFEARDTATRAEAKVDEAVAAAAERSAQLSADVAALNAEMEEMRKLSRAAVEEGVPPPPEREPAAPPASEPAAPEEMLLAAQDRAAAAKMDASIDEATRWNSREAREAAEEQMLEAEVAAEMMAEEVAEFEALVERVASSPGSPARSAKQQAVQRAALAACEAMLDLEDAASPRPAAAAATPSPRTRVRNMQSAEELEVELAVADSALIAKEVEIAEMAVDLIEVKQAPPQQQRAPLKLATTRPPAVSVVKELTEGLSSLAGGVDKADAAAATTEVENWTHLAQRTTGRVMVIQSEKAAVAKKAAEANDAAAAAAAELDSWMDMAKRAAMGGGVSVLTGSDVDSAAAVVELVAWVGMSKSLSGGGAVSGEKVAMKAQVDDALKNVSVLIESNIALRQKLHAERGEKQEMVSQALTTASMIVQTSDALRRGADEDGVDWKAKYHELATQSPSSREVLHVTEGIVRAGVHIADATGSSDAAVWKEKYKASHAEMQAMCEKVEAFTSNLQETVSSAAEWHARTDTLEAEAAVNRSKIAELETGLETEREGSAQAQKELKKWIKLNLEISAAAGELHTSTPSDRGIGLEPPGSPNSKHAFFTRRPTLAVAVFASTESSFGCACVA